MRTNIYVDGESHFIRTQSAWRELHGTMAELISIRHVQPILNSISYPPNQPFIRLEPKAKFFWDTYYPHLTYGFFAQRLINGAVYFSSASGSDEALHTLRVTIRQHGFDPKIGKEPSPLADQRKNVLSNQGVLEKPKGVDIGLSVRVLEDAYQKIFDNCYLFTSDIDFLPVVQALQRIGRKVVVFGYVDGLGSQSDLEYVPDAFIDLGEYMRTQYIGVEQEESAPT